MAHLTTLTVASITQRRMVWLPTRNKVNEYGRSPYPAVHRPHYRGPACIDIYRPETLSFFLSPSNFKAIWCFLSSKILCHWNQVAQFWYLQNRVDYVRRTLNVLLWLTLIHWSMQDITHKSNSCSRFVLTFKENIRPVLNLTASECQASHPVRVGEARGKLREMWGQETGGVKLLEMPEGWREEDQNIWNKIAKQLKGIWGERKKKKK